MAVSTIIGLLITAGSFFTLGAYYQHYDVNRNIQRLERNDHHAFFIRRKLYSLLSIFRPITDEIETNQDDWKLSKIMKYGFPSMNGIKLSKNYVTSFDRRNSAFQWMCELIEISEDPRQSELCNETGETEGDLLLKYSEAAYTFYLTNIKPFMSQGFNMSLWEMLLRNDMDMAIIHGAVYVYTGPIYAPRQLNGGKWYLEHQLHGSSTVAVPTHFFKVIIIDPQQGASMPYAEAFAMPIKFEQSEITTMRNLQTDVRDIENATGLQFFEGLHRNFVREGGDRLLNELQP